MLSFVAFIAGSFAAVLFLATILDPDLFLNFEITPHRTVFFYLGVFGAILTVARGMVPEDNRVFDPELLMKEVITYTHYMPDEWDSQLHSKKVCLFLLSPAIIFTPHKGSSRIWGVVCYESFNFRTGASLRNSDAVCTLVLPSCMCAGNH